MLTAFVICTGSSGVRIEDLEDEDARLVQVSSSDESDFEGLYHQRIQLPSEVINEIWNLTDEEEVDTEFLQHHGAPSVDATEPGRSQQRGSTIVRWMLLFLCLWASFCSISDNALEILLLFLRAVFDSLATVFPVVAGFATLFPQTLHIFRKHLGIDKDKFMKYVVCPKCHSLYNFEDCYRYSNGRNVPVNCSFVEYPSHRQLFRRTKCGEPLLKEVTLKSGRTKLYPFKVYCYNSIIENLRRFIKRPGFLVKCEMWRKRNVPNGFLADIFDGRVWKEWQVVNGEPFLAAPRNLAFMLNVDWFQPFKHSLYSVGVLYLVLMNLPRAERFKPENVFLVGVIPGPHEPKLHINSYLRPLVAELNVLWNEGISEMEHGSTVRNLFRAALICVGCDVPAARKVCGFTGHGSSKGCSKCNKFFPGSVTTKLDFSGFETCPKRTNEQHRQEAQEILDQTSASDQNQLEQKYGTRFSELLMLPYFDSVIDPMHNLFTGTAKHVMKNIWLDSGKPLLNKNDLLKLQEKVDKIQAPADVGRMPKKIQNSYGGFTADQWKSFTILFSVYAVYGILPSSDLELWRDFVMTCSLFCSTVITESRAQLAHSYILKFCRNIEELYGKHRITPNMHLHTHILDCILDYGPVYSFWLFSFECYNGILGEYGTNQRAVEIQLMRKFTSDQFVKDIPWPTEFQEIFKPVFSRLLPKQAGTLQEQFSFACNMSVENGLTTSISDIDASLLSLGPVKKGDKWTTTVPLFSCCGPFQRDVLDSSSLPCLKKCYNAIFSGLDETSVTVNFERYAACRFSGDCYGSLKTRTDRSSFILARWCTLGGKIDYRGTDLRPGVVDFFMKQNIVVNGKYIQCVLAAVRWFQPHPARHLLGVPVEVWCKDLFELEGEASFIPVQRIHGKFIPVFDTVERERVLVMCPLPRKLQC